MCVSSRVSTWKLSFSPFHSRSVVTITLMNKLLTHVRIEGTGLDYTISLHLYKQSIVAWLRKDDNNPKMIGLHGKHINLFIEPGPSLGPVLEVTVDNAIDAKQRLVEEGCEIVKEVPNCPRCYVKDPFGLIYNLTS
jgi:hypothetical protein